MNTNRPIVIAGLIAALSMGAVSVAEASSRTTHFASTTRTHFVFSTTPTVAPVDPDVAVLAKLVAAGTITQAQSDAVLAALKAARPTRPVISGSGNGRNGDDNGLEGGNGLLRMSLRSDQAVILSTLGITAAQLQTDFAAGKSLATIAGTNTTALINALVTAETTKINARVTAGSITQAQATTLIAGLNAAVTAAVNLSFGQGMAGFGGMGHRFHGGPGAPSVTPPTTSDSN